MFPKPLIVEVQLTPETVDTWMLNISDIFFDVSTETDISWNC